MKITFPLLVVVIMFFLLALLNQIGEDDFKTIFGSMSSFIGGVLGAIAAYFIARAQINHQESSKTIDMKLQHLEVIRKSSHNIVKELEDLRMKLYKNSDSPKKIAEINDFFTSFREEKKDVINHNLSEIEEVKLFLKLLGEEPESVMSELKWRALNYSFVGEFDFSEDGTYQKVVSALTNDIKWMKNFKAIVDKEIDKIIF